MATNEELSKYLCEHYAYEVMMLRYLGLRLQEPSETLLWNALFESFGIHARSRRDFYTNDQDPRNYRAKDFGVHPFADRREYENHFNLISQQIAHLGKRRAFDDEGKKLRLQRCLEVAAWLLAKHDEFIARCAPDSKQGWDDAMTTAGVGKAEMQSASSHATSAGKVIQTQSTSTSGVFIYCSNDAGSK